MTRPFGNRHANALVQMLRDDTATIEAAFKSPFDIGRQEVGQVGRHPRQRIRVSFQETIYVHEWTFMGCIMLEQPVVDLVLLG